LPPTTTPGFSQDSSGSYLARLDRCKAHLAPLLQFHCTCIISLVLTLRRFHAVDRPLHFFVFAPSPQLFARGRMTRLSISGINTTYHPRPYLLTRHPCYYHAVVYESPDAAYVRPPSPLDPPPLGLSSHSYHSRPGASGAIYHLCISVRHVSNSHAFHALYNFPTLHRIKPNLSPASNLERRLVPACLAFGHLSPPFAFCFGDPTRPGSIRSWHL